MGEVRATRNIFLRFMCAIYLFAFLSFYVQIPGLYGDNGILPAKNLFVMEKENRYSEKSFFDHFMKKPTLLWFAPSLGLNVNYMMDILALTGAFISFCAFISRSWCIFPVYLTLWVLYYSLFQVGQTFMQFQWDILLLEAGFLCILCAPIYNRTIDERFSNTPTDQITFFLVKWLLFRLTFANGVVKLDSGCPSWWNLSALEIQFESQPLPTPLAWFAHHLPSWILKLATVFTFVVEQFLPFLYFFPIRAVRTTGFLLQVLLQAFIILTGNYNFFNLLTIILSLSLLDDKIFTKRRGQRNYAAMFLNGLANIVIHGFIFYVAAMKYNFRVNDDGTVSSAITFTKTEFDLFVKRAVPASIYIGGMSLFVLAFYAIWKCFKGRRHRLPKLMVTVGYICAAYFVFGLTLVPHAALHKSSNNTIFPAFRAFHEKLSDLHIANSYGLFRKMTGVGGRPEVVIEGANDVNGPWKEYQFKYKPTNPNASLSFVFPHQPRLDWHMWFAAMGTYHQNPWLMSFVYRLLCGEPDVLKLMNRARIPFKTPPKYLRASLYEYHFSPWHHRFNRAWWVREKVGEYFPIFTKNHAPLKNYLKSLKILDSDGYDTNEGTPEIALWLKDSLDYLRMKTGKADPPIFIWSVFLAACLIIISVSLPNSSPKKKSNPKPSLN